MERIAAGSGAWHGAKINRRLFEHIRDNQDFYRVALPNYRSLLSDRSRAKDYDEMFAPAYEQLGIEGEDEKRLFRTFVDNGFQSVLSEWVEGGCALDITSVGHVLEICLFMMGLRDPHPDQEG